MSSEPCAVHPGEDATNGCRVCKCKECGLPQEHHDHHTCLAEQLKNVRAELREREPSHVFRPLNTPSLFERQRAADAMSWRLVTIRLLLAQQMIARYEKDRDHELESFFAFCVQLAKE